MLNRWSLLGAGVFMAGAVLIAQTPPSGPAPAPSPTGHGHGHGHSHGTAAAKPASASAPADVAEARHVNMWSQITHAIAVVHPTKGHQASGTVRFITVPTGVRVIAEITGLSPNGVHGFHIHEWGDCSAPDATSAGSHYNPDGHPHGGPHDAVRHAGDFGNLQADAQGNAKLDFVVDNITIAGLKNPVIGRSVIVHVKADDLKSQPTGDAGGRIGCGVIGIAKPTAP